MKNWLSKVFNGAKQSLATAPVDIATRRVQEAGKDAGRTDATQTSEAQRLIDPQAIQVGEAQGATEWKVGDVILDLYEVKQVHEGGGMGLVYRVHHRGWNLDLAVKSPRAEYFQTEAQKENFTRECETWINLGLHPHIVSCHYVRTLGGIPRVFAEYVEGGSLKEWIDSRRLYEGGPQEALKRILDTAIQMAWGLHYAHEQGVVHQDVKPANVMMRADGTAKITDFGLAKARALAGESPVAAAGRSILASSGWMTPAYCSPEQASEQPLSRKTDIWSWGVSLLEMLIGEVCWQSGTAAPELLKRLGEVRVDGVGIPEPPPVLVDLLERCFATAAAGRPENCRIVAGVLESIYGSLAGGAYIRQFPEAAEHQADTLNNQALSLLDLPKPELAFSGHTHNVSAVAISADGHRALSGSGDATLRFWEVASRRCLGVFKGHTGAVVSVALLADGRLALSGSTDKTLRLWDTATARCVKVLTGHPCAVSSVALSADGRWALSGSDWLNMDSAVRLWDLAAGRCVRTFAGHKGGVTSVAFSADGRLAVSGSSDRTFRLWEVATGRCLRTLEGHTGNVVAVALSADGRLAASASHDKTLRLWKTDSGLCVRTLQGHTGPVDAVALSADGHVALSGSRDKTLRLWDVENGRCLRRIAEPPEAAASVALSANGRWAVSAGPDHLVVRLWDLANRYTDAPALWDEALRLSPGHPEATYNRSIFLWRKGELTDKDVLDLVGLVKERPAMNWRKAFLRGLVHLERGDRQAWVQELEAAMQESGGCPEVRQVLEMAKGRKDEAEWETAFEGDGSCVAISADERWAVTDGNDGKLNVWDVGQGRCVNSLEGHTGPINAVALSPDGRWALSASDDTTVRVWDLARGQCLHVLRGHKTGVTCVAISPDSRWALSAAGGDTQDDSDTALRLWDLVSGLCVRTMTGHTKAVSSIAISPDGRSAVSGGWDGILYLWDLPSGERKLVLDREDYLAESIVFSPDCASLLTGGGIRRLRLYDLKSVSCWRQFKGFTDDQVFVAISPDGRWGASLGGQSNMLRIWDLNTEQCVRTLEPNCRVVLLRHRCCSGRRLLVGSPGQFRFCNWPATRHPSPYAICRPAGAAEQLRLLAEFRAGVRRASELLARHEHLHALTELQKARQVSSFEDAPEILDLKCAIGRFGRQNSLRRIIFRNRLAGHRRDVVSVVLSADARFALSGSWDMTMRLWDLASGRCLRVFQGHDFDVQAVALSNTRQHLLTASYDKSVRQWNIETGECLRILEGHTRGASTVALFPGNRLAVSGGNDHLLRLWDLSAGTCIRTFRGHSGDVKSVAVSADGRWMISGSRDKTLRLWDTANGQCLKALTGSEGFVDSVCVLGNGYGAVSGGQDKMVRLWDLAAGNGARVLQGHKGPINSVTCSADGKWIVSGGDDATVRLWELATGRCLSVLEGHKEPVNSVAMSLDGRWILSGSSDSTLRLWELDWDYEFPEVTDWDEQASRCLSVFLHLHCELARDGVTRNGPPRWDEQDFQDLLTELQLRGFGWLCPEGVRRQLEKVTSQWEGPPLLPWMVRT
jgi:WD40 repeat protein